MYICIYVYSVHFFTYFYYLIFNTIKLVFDSLFSTSCNDLQVYYFAHVYIESDQCVSMQTYLKSRMSKQCYYPARILTTLV